MLIFIPIILSNKYFGYAELSGNLPKQHPYPFFIHKYIQFIPPIERAVVSFIKIRV